MRIHRAKLVDVDDVARAGHEPVIVKLPSGPWQPCVRSPEMRDIASNGLPWSMRRAMTLMPVSWLVAVLRDDRGP